MRILEQCYPNRFFYYFEEIAGIPHGSGNTKAISDYLVCFAKEHGLEWYQDDSNNVIIIKEATKGYETASPIIIQGHMDMVCEKEKDVSIDFEKDGLSLYIEDDFVRAKGTTLGGDDGIAVCFALALLESNEISHPRLEVVLTVDEEVGMLGAEVMDVSPLKGRMMLNIDSDEEGRFLTSCAGGLSLNGTIPVQRTRQEGRKIEILITGLLGGHSGSEIDKERANADILMGRVLHNLFQKLPLGIISLSGGLKDNAIPRECHASILIPAEAFEIVSSCVRECNETLQKEYLISDPELRIELTDQGVSEETILDFSSTNRVILYLRTVCNGVQHMSRSIDGLVETSLNLGIMELKEDALHLVHSLRSSVESRKEDLCRKVSTLLDMVGGECEIEGNYPAWEYKPNSPLREQITNVYEALFDKKPIFDAIHAGLECGLFSDKISELDCVSFGPDIFDIHTPKERLSISSTGRMWDFLVELLKQCKES